MSKWSIIIHDEDDIDRYVVGFYGQWKGISSTRDKKWKGEFDYLKAKEIAENLMRLDYNKFTFEKVKRKNNATT